MNQVPLITVVVPTCDKPAFLEKCLAALAPGAQSLEYGQYEVVVSDDGPRQEARTLVQERFPWARWVVGPRRGPAANRNAGARQARAPLLAFTDDDCVPTSVWLQAFLAAASDGGGVAFEGRTITPAFETAWDEAPSNMNGGYFWSCNILIEARAFRGLGGFDENYPYPALEDVDLRYALGSAGKVIRFVPNAVVHHPLRRTTFWRKLARIPQLGWHVYLHRKWHPAAPPKRAASLILGLLRVSVVQPLRIGLPGRAALAGIGLLYTLIALVAFPYWDRKAGKLLLRRVAGDSHDTPAEVAGTGQRP